MKHRIQTSEAPKAIGPYSQAIKTANVVYLSGQIPLVPSSMQLISENFREQVKQVFLNLQAVAQAAGGDLNNIVKLTIYLIDLDQFATLNDVMMEFFTEPYPARVTIQVSALPKAAQVEIDAIMEVA